MRERRTKFSSPILMAVSLFGASAIAAAQNTSPASAEAAANASATDKAAIRSIRASIRPLNCG